MGARHPAAAADPSAFSGSVRSLSSSGSSAARADGGELASQAERATPATLKAFCWLACLGRKPALAPLRNARDVSAGLPWRVLPWRGARIAHVHPRLAASEDSRSRLAPCAARRPAAGAIRRCQALHSSGEGEAAAGADATDALPPAIFVQPLHSRSKSMSDASGWHLNTARQMPFALRHLRKREMHDEAQLALEGWVQRRLVVAGEDARPP